MIGNVIIKISSQILIESRVTEENGPEFSVIEPSLI